MKVVYIAGPYSGPNAWAIEQNVRRAEEAGLFVAECGAMPIIPHTNTRFFHGLLTEAFWYAGTMELLKRCDGIMLIDRWMDSIGSKAEFEMALARKIPIFVQRSMIYNGFINDYGMDTPSGVVLFKKWCSE